MTHDHFFGERHTGRSYPRAKVPSDYELLYHTLVADGAVPSGYLKAFLRLEEPAKKAAERRQRQYACLSESSAAMELERAREHQSVQRQAERHQVDQLVMLAELRPRRSSLARVPRPEGTLNRT